MKRVRGVLGVAVVSVGLTAGARQPGDVQLGGSQPGRVQAGALPSARQLPPDHPPLPPAGEAAPVPADAELPSGHPQVTDGKAPPTAEQLLQQMDATPGLKERDKTFEMAAMMGRLYLHNGRPQDARHYLAQAEAKGAGLRQLLVGERAKLTAAQRAAARTQAGCALAPDAPMEVREREVRARLQTGDRVAAVACARTAVGPLLEVLAQSGHAALLAGDAPGALAAHGRALELDPTDEESLFARSAVLYETQGQDVKALTRARDGLELLIARHPQGARTPQARVLLQVVKEAVAAGGVKARSAKRAAARRAQLARDFPTMEAASTGAMAVAGGPGGTGVPAGGAMGPAGGASAGATGAPALSREMVEAVQNVERTPEFEAGLDKALAEGEEHLAHGRYEEALASYRQVMPFRPQDGRTQAGLAWSLLGLKKPMGDRVWGVAVQSAPAAVEALGDTLEARGNVQEARAVWTRLSQSAPGYAGKGGLEQKLK